MEPAAAPTSTDAMLLVADPHEFLAALQPRSRLTPRKARLLAIALARHHWKLLPEAGRKAVAVAELHADGLVDDGALMAAWTKADAAMRVAESDRRRLCAEAACCAAWPAMGESLEFVRSFVLELAAEMTVGATLQVRWLACLLGDPLQPVIIPESVRTATVVTLARAALAEPSADRLARAFT